MIKMTLENLRRSCNVAGNCALQVWAGLLAHQVDGAGPPSQHLLPVAM
jgi:hypothetical protein